MTGNMGWLMLMCAWSLVCRHSHVADDCSQVECLLCYCGLQHFHRYAQASFHRHGKAQSALQTLQYYFLLLVACI